MSDKRYTEEFKIAATLRPEIKKSISEVVNYGLKVILLRREATQTKKLFARMSKTNLKL